MKEYKFTSKETLLAIAELPARTITDTDMKKYMEAFSKKIHEDFGQLSYLLITQKYGKLCACTSEVVCVPIK